MPSVTTEQITEVKLAPTLKTRLVKKLRVFALNKAQMEALAHANEKIKGEIEQMFTEAGEFGAMQAGVKVEGFTVRHVSPVTSRFDRKKAIAAGFISAAQIEECSKATPGKPYVRVNTPGDSAEDE